MNLFPARGIGCSVLEHSQAEVAADVSSRVLLEDVAVDEAGDREISIALRRGGKHSFSVLSTRQDLPPPGGLLHATR